MDSCKNDHYFIKWSLFHMTINKRLIFKKKNYQSLKYDLQLWDYLCVRRLFLMPTRWCCIKKHKRKGLSPSLPFLYLQNSIVTKCVSFSLWENLILRHTCIVNHGDFSLLIYVILYINIKTKNSMYWIYLFWKC